MNVESNSELRVVKPESPTSTPGRVISQAHSRAGWRHAYVTVAFLVVLTWHSRETLLSIPPGFSEPNPLPFTVNDHPFHYYYSQITADFVSRRRAVWGYDPFFMAGYAKTIIFPTGCTPSEAVAVLFGKNAPVAYRGLVASCLFLPPFALALATRTITRGWGSAVAAFAVSVIWVWCGWPVAYVSWGMAPFVLGITTSIAAASLLGRWLAEPSKASIIGGGFLATVATIAHPCSPVVLAVLLTPAYLASFRILSWRRHAFAWLVPICVLGCWAPWWLPAWSLRETFGSTETGFVNENVMGRIEELLNARFLEETTLLLAGLFSAVALPSASRLRRALLFGLATLALVAAGGARFGCWRIALIADSLPRARGDLNTWIVDATWIGDLWPILAIAAITFAWYFASGGVQRWDALTWMFVAGPVGFFVITYIGGGVQWLWALQPGRYTQPLYAALVVQAVSGMTQAVRQTTSGATRRERWVALAVCGMGVAALAIEAPRVWLRLGEEPQRLLASELPPQVAQLIAFLHQETDDSGRVLFEDHGDADLGGSHPFGGTNPSALLPLLAPGQYIGGPYLKTHLKSNFTNFGDFRLCGHSIDTLDRRMFERYCELYNVRWMAAWSPRMLRFADTHPNLCRPLGQFGPVRVFGIARASNWAIIGRAFVRAELDKLEVSRASPDSTGRLILSYHWIHTLRSSVPLRPVMREDDPVPFIEVVGAPPEFVIENR